MTSNFDLIDPAIDDPEDLVVEKLVLDPFNSLFVPGKRRDSKNMLADPRDGADSDVETTIF